MQKKRGRSIIVLLFKIFALAAGTTLPQENRAFHLFGMVWGSIGGSKGTRATQWACGSTLWRGGHFNPSLGCWEAPKPHSLHPWPSTSVPTVQAQVNFSILMHLFCFHFSLLFFFFVLFCNRAGRLCILHLKSVELADYLHWPCVSVLT